MKHLIMWGSLALTCAIVFIFWNRTTIMELWNDRTSPIYVDVVLILILGLAFITRLIALIRKLL